jgi:hypothetical protein
MLNDIQNYYQLLGKEIKTSKTKTMIFEGKKIHKRIEVVKYFKYLGITLYKYDNWYRTQKHICYLYKTKIIGSIRAKMECQN